MSLLLEKKNKQNTHKQTKKPTNKWKKKKKHSKSLEFQTIITKDMVKRFSWFYTSVPHVFKIKGI